MAYLDQGIDNQYAVVLESPKTLRRYKVVMSADGTIVTSEKTSLATGVYQAKSDVQETDKNITQAILSLYNKPLKRAPTYNISNYVLTILDMANDTFEFDTIIHVPKMTKALATNLGAIKEAMVFNYSENSRAYEFLCFGYRRVIAEALESYSAEPIFLFADRFFTGASFDTRFKPNNLFMAHLQEDNCVLITNDIETIDKISIIMSVNWERHTEYLERSLVDD